MNDRKERIPWEVNDRGKGKERNGKMGRGI